MIKYGIGILPDGEMASQRPLKPFFLVRIQVRQPVRIGRRSGGSAFRARLHGKRVKSAFFETCGQPPIL